MSDFHPPAHVGEEVAYSKSNKAHEIGGLAWAVRLALHEAEIPFVLVGTGQLKRYACGKGNADKNAVLTAAVRRLGYGGSDDNEADALWLREMALDQYGIGGGCRVPTAQREALVKVDWPRAGRRAA